MDPDVRLVRGPWATLPAASAARLDAVLDAARGGAVVALPRVRGLAPAVVARWLHRRRVRVGESAGFGHLDVQHLPADPRARADGWAREASRCAGGVLLVEGVCPAVDAAALRELAPERDLAVLVPGDDELEPPRAALLAGDWDALHAVTMDPTLADVRDSILALAASASCFGVSGPPGSGRRSLVQWARAAVDPAAPLLVAGPADRVPPPEGWRVFEDVEQRDEQGLTELAACARRRLSRPPPAAPLRPAGRDRPPDPELRGIVGADPALVELLWRVRREAPLGGRALKNTIVLVLGPTGAGKQAIARALHDLSERRAGPFVQVNLGAVEELVQAQLFGIHGQGKNYPPGPGLFEEARGGTLFLDEVGCASRKVQNALLTVVEQFRARRVTAPSDYAVDARLVFATNTDLAALADAGAFNPDFYARIRGCTLVVPSLDSRSGDLPALARALSAEHAPGVELSDDVVRALRGRPWPGNVRELSNVLRDAYSATGGQPLRPEDVVRRLAPVVWITARRDVGGSARGPRMPEGAVIDVGGVVERPAAAREAVRAAAAPRPVSAEAASQLAGAAWWGNFRELRDAIVPVSALPPGPVDAGLLRRSFAGRRELGPPEALVLLLAPAVVRGAVVGFELVVRHEAALLGRHPSVLLEGSPARRGRPKGEGHDWTDDARWVERECGGRTPAPLELTGLAFLSRAQILLRQVEQGVRVGRLPGGRLAVHVTSLHDGETRDLEPGDVVSCGPAVELVLAGRRGGRPLLRLYVAVGAEARASLAEYVAEGRDGEAVTILPDGEGRTVSGEAPPPRVWALSEVQSAAFCTFVSEFAASGGGSFSAALGAVVPRWSGTEAGSALAAYLERADATRRNTYAQRLVWYRGNRPLRDALRGVLDDVPPERRAAFPLWLRKLRGDTPEEDE